MARAAFRSRGKEVYREQADVYVGLDLRNEYLFPRALQAEYLARGDRGTGKTWSARVAGPGIRIDGAEVDAVKFSGFSKLAERGMDPGNEIETDFRRFVELVWSRSLPSLNDLDWFSERIPVFIRAYQTMLAFMGLRLESDWPQISDNYADLFPFPFSVDHSVNLFRTTNNFVRRVLLEHLMRSAYRGNIREKREEMDKLVAKNLADRRRCSALDFEQGGAAAIERLDSDLRIALVQEISRRRNGKDYVPEQGWKNLDLFMLGDVYRNARKLFFGISTLFEEKGVPYGGVFRRIAQYHAFRMELDCMKAALRKEESSQVPYLGRGVDMMLETGDHLACQGARVIEAFERISGQDVNMSYLLALPAPFDLYSVIGDHYTPQA